MGRADGAPRGRAPTASSPRDQRALQHGRPRVITASDDNTARVWDAKTGQPLDALLSEKLTAFCSAARLDPALGTLHQLSFAERMKLWQELESALAATPDWLFAARQFIPGAGPEAAVSPRMAMTTREATTRLLSTAHPATIREALSTDPATPLLPFAYSLIESREDKDLNVSANLPRAAWLIDYGLKRLPADTPARDLRIAAQLIAKAAENFPEAERAPHRKTALSLLDRAARDKDATPEDEETKALRASPTPPK